MHISKFHHPSHYFMSVYLSVCLFTVCAVLIHSGECVHVFKGKDLYSDMFCKGIIMERNLFRVSGFSPLVN